MTFADDAGEYSVFAKNPLGEASATAILLDEGIRIFCFLFLFPYCITLHNSKYYVFDYFLIANISLQLEKVVPRSDYFSYRKNFFPVL